MPSRPILILSAWSSGSPLISGFLGNCGAYLCPPFARANDPNSQKTYESEMYRGLVQATVNEHTLQYKVEPSVFRNGFQSWFNQQTHKASDANAQNIVLNHPLSVFLLDEICSVVDPIFLVVTRSFSKIEATRARQDLPPVYGKEGAQIIYERIYSYLHDREKTFLAIPFRNFASSEECRFQIVDFCGLDSTDNQIRNAFTTVYPKQN